MKRSPIQTQQPSRAPMDVTSLADRLCSANHGMPPARTDPVGSKLPWVVYCRVSTDEQVIGKSLENQESICRDFAAKSGMKILTAVVDGGQSGKNLCRPGIYSILGMVEKGEIAGILVSKLDRLSRSLKDLLNLVHELCERNVAIQCALEQFETNTSSGRAMFSIRGIFAEMERNICSERQRVSQHYRKEKGLFTGGIIPVGYRATGPEGERRLEPDPIWGPIVARCWELIAEGRSVRQCATYLQQHGVPNHRGGRWSTSTVCRMLHRSLKAPQLIDEAKMQEARSILQSRFSPQKARRRKVAPQSPMPSHKTDRVWLLQGMSRCAHCGAALVGTHGNGKGGRYFYLQCCGRAHGATGDGACTAIRLPADAWEQATIDALRHALQQDDLLLAALIREAATWHERMAPLRARRGALLQDLKQASQNLDRLMCLALESPVMERAVTSRIERSQQDKDRTQAALISVESELSLAQNGLDDPRSLRSLLMDGLAEWDHATPEEKQTILRGLLEYVSMGTTTDGPLPLVLGIRIPTDRGGGGGQGHPTRMATLGSANAHPAPAPAPSPSGSTPPYPANTPENTEPPTGIGGSDSHSL